MRYLITGGVGFIGSHLTDLLLKSGHSVTALDDLSTGRIENVAHIIKNENFKLVVDTILNEMVLDRLVSDCDVVIHLAAAVGVKLIVDDPFHTIRTNVIGTDCVLKACCRYRKKVLIASTSEIYGKNSKMPFSEDDDTTSGPTYKQRWAYACSKALDEFAALACARSSDLPVVILRFFNTVGPRQTGRYGMVIPTLMKQAMRGEDLTVYGDGEQSRCFTNVKYVIKAIVDILSCDKAIGEVFNVGGNEKVTINQLAEKIIKVTGSKSKIKLIPYSEAYQEGFEDMRSREPNLAKIKGVIDYNPEMTLEQTLQEIHEYLKKEVK